MNIVQLVSNYKKTIMIKKEQVYSRNCIKYQKKMKRPILNLFVVAIIVLNLKTAHQVQIETRKPTMEIVAAVETQLQQGSPIESINKMIGGFSESVNQEQSLHDNVYRTQKQECEKEIAYRETELQDAGESLRLVTQEVEFVTRQKGFTESKLNMASKSLNENKDHLLLITNVIAEAINQYNSKSANYRDAISAVDKAISLFQKSDSGDSYLEIARTSGILIKYAVSLQMIDNYYEVLTLLTQMTQGTTSVDTRNLLFLLDSLKDDLNDQFDSYSDQYSESTKNFTDQQQQIEQNIKRLDTQVESLRQQISAHEVNLASKNSLSQSAQNKLSRSSSMLVDARGLCEAAENEHKLATANRNNELQIISDLDFLVSQKQLSNGNL